MRSDKIQLRKGNVAKLVAVKPAVEFENAAVDLNGSSGKVISEAATGIKTGVSKKTGRLSSQLYT